MKAVADYETGPDAGITPERAIAAVAMARRFVEQVTLILEQADPP